MKVKCIKRYNDTQLKRSVEVDEEFEVAAARGKTLLNARVCEEVVTTTTTEKVVKQTRKKKEA